MDETHAVEGLDVIWLLRIGEPGPSVPRVALAAGGPVYSFSLPGVLINYLEISLRVDDRSRRKVLGQRDRVEKLLVRDRSPPSSGRRALFPGEEPCSPGRTERTSEAVPPDDRQVGGWGFLVRPFPWQEDGSTP